MCRRQMPETGVAGCGTTSVRLLAMQPGAIMLHGPASEAGDDVTTPAGRQVSVKPDGMP